MTRVHLPLNKIDYCKRVTSGAAKCSAQCAECRREEYTELFFGGPPVPFKVDPYLFEEGD